MRVTRGGRPWSRWGRITAALTAALVVPLTASCPCPSLAAGAHGCCSDDGVRVEAAVHCCRGSVAQVPPSAPAPPLAGAVAPVAIAAPALVVLDVPAETPLPAGAAPPPVLRI